MKPHATEVVGNLVTSADDGSVWAVWQILPVPQRLASDDDRFAHHSAVARFARGLQRPALMFSACQPITPSLLEAAMTEEAVPSIRLTRRVDDTVDIYLEGGQALYERTYWVAAQIEGGTGDRMAARAGRAAQGAWRQAWPWINRVDYDDEDTGRHRLLAAAAEEVEARCGLDVVGVSSTLVATPGRLTAKRATLGDVEWLTVRLARRGTSEEIALTDWDTKERRSNRAGMLRLNDAAWSENAIADANELALGSGRRRHVVAEVDEGGPYSYQTSMVMASQPAELFFPGGFSEWLQLDSGRTEEEGVFPVDAYLYVEPKRDRKSRRKIDRRLTNAADQPDQTDEGTGVATKEHVLNDIDMLTDLSDQVSAGEPKLDVVAWFTICASSYEQMRRREAAFRRLWNMDTWKLTRPLDQLALARASQPGAELPPKVLRDYKRDQLPDRLAAAAPFSGSEVGDPYGALIAVNLGDGLCGPVFWDPGWGIRNNVGTGSAIFVGVSGGGKSVAKKSLMAALMLRGSRFVALDPAGEYVKLAEAVGGQLVDPADPHHSLDPLLIHAGMVNPDANARERTIEACIAIVDALSKRGIEPMSMQWAELRRYIEHALDERGRFSDVIRWVVADAERKRKPDEAPSPFAEMAKPLAVAARISSLASIFDEYLAPLAARTPLTVITLRGVTVPKADKASASAQELQGQALMTAALHAAKEAVYEDKSRYGAVVSDEARAYLATSYGQNMMHDLFDQGRKFHAGGWFSVTDPDVVPEMLWDQADTRFFFRLGSDRSVRRACSLLGSPGEDVTMGQTLREARPGECVMRDVRHRVSKVHIALPPEDALRAAVDTTPTLDLTPDNQEDAA